MKDNIPVHTSARTTRSSSQILLRAHTKSKFKSWGDKSIYIIMEREWNKLPPDLRNNSNLLSFRKNLKTHLFSVAF
jgi:hypothetical protein